LLVHLKFYKFKAAKSLDGLTGSRVLWKANVQLRDFRPITRAGVLDNDIDLHMSARI
jgi:hypothetical protein